MLDFSQQRELSLHAAVAADIAKALSAPSVPGVVVGAFVRDLHLHYCAGIPVQRETEDIDFALLVSSWKEFHSTREHLIQEGAFRAVVSAPHRLKHRSPITVDLVPFGTIEGDDRRIFWPTDGHAVMDAFGFREALASSAAVRLPGNVEIQLVSLPALALLKLIAWNDRHRRSSSTRPKLHRLGCVENVRRAIHSQNRLAAVGVNTRYRAKRLDGANSVR